MKKTKVWMVSLTLAASLGSAGTALAGPGVGMPPLGYIPPTDQGHDDVRGQRPYALTGSPSYDEKTWPKPELEWIGGMRSQVVVYKRVPISND